jgi:cytochrome c
MRKFVGVLGALGLLAGAPALAQGTSDPGERAFSYCFSCHSVQADQTEILSGPNLNGVIGRPIAGKAGFEYTPELKAFGQGKVWTEALILEWIANPRMMVPGTRMERPPGPRTPVERTALMEYLKKAH